MSTKPLKLNGKPLNLHPPSPSVSRITSFLDKQPTDEIFTADELSKRAGVATLGSGRFSTQEVFNPYSVRHGRVRYWGNPKAIAAFREQVGQ